MYGPIYSGIMQSAPQWYRSLLVVLFIFCSSQIYAQGITDTSTYRRLRADYASHENREREKQSRSVFTLKDCLRYALKRQPALNQAFIDESIASTNIALAFSSWLPQVMGTANYQHYFNMSGGANTTGTPANESVPQINVSQAIFSPDLLLAIKSARLSRLGASQNTTSVKINLVSDVSKAFYDLLLSIEQKQVYMQDTTRLKKNLSDAYHRYVSGISDMVDYKQATISLNNSLSQLKSATEAITAKYAALGKVMGYTGEQQFAINFDTTEMLQEIYVDTLSPVWLEKRIEYQQLLTTRRIQQANTMYYEIGFLPSLSAFYNSYFPFQSDHFSDLYGRAYPYSIFGIQLSIPIFTGFRRLENIHKSKLQEVRIDWDEVNLKLQIIAEYNLALSNYKSSLYNFREQSDNEAMAKEVYDIVRLQYNEGIKAYLDVIVAESSLETSEINYLNALFQLLQSKIDLQKAMGDINTDI